MKKVYLFCNAGMSTSLVANDMQKVEDEYNLPMEIKAFNDSSMSEVVKKENPDVILLGPQVKYKLADTKKTYEPKISVGLINAEDYGKVDGERILKYSIKLIQDREKES